MDLDYDEGLKNLSVIFMLLMMKVGNNLICDACTIGHSLFLVTDCTDGPMCLQFLESEPLYTWLFLSVTPCFSVRPR